MTNKRSLISQSPPPCVALKSNHDGTRGKPGPTGIGGVLRNYKGEVLFMFKKNVGVKYYKGASS